MLFVSAWGELVSVQPFPCWMAYCVPRFMIIIAGALCRGKGIATSVLEIFEACVLSVWSTLLMISTARTSVLYFGQKWLLISKRILCIVKNNPDWLFCRCWDETLEFACFEVLGKLKIPVWICGKWWSLPSWKLSWDERIFWPWKSVAMTVWKAIGWAAVPWCSPNGSNWAPSSCPLGLGSHLSVTDCWSVGHRRIIKSTSLHLFQWNKILQVYETPGEE